MVWGSGSWLPFLLRSRKPSCLPIEISAERVSNFHFTPFSAAEVEWPRLTASRLHGILARCAHEVFVFHGGIAGHNFCGCAISAFVGAINPGRRSTKSSRHG